MLSLYTDMELRTPEALLAAADAYKEAHPHARIRGIADALGVSEAELVAARCGDGVVRLRPDWRACLGGLEACGTLMALTRNSDCVHERKGVYENPEFDESGRTALFVNEDIDLRIFPTRWQHAYWVEDAQTNADPRLSIQWFDASGLAVHKIYATEGTRRDAFRALAETLRHDDQTPGLSVAPAAPVPAEKPLADLDVAGFVEAWEALQDTHDFFGLLRRFGLSRRQAVHVAPAHLARPVPAQAARRVLEEAAAAKVPIMVFVGSPGCVQIHTGTVEKLLETGPWFNVLDPDFNLHLRQDAIAEAFVVVKPTVDGVVTALEVFDAKGELIVQFFGKRKPGIPEREDWQALVARVEAEAAVTDAA